MDEGFFFPGGWGVDGRQTQATAAVALVHIAQASSIILSLLLSDYLNRSLTRPDFPLCPSFPINLLSAPMQILNAIAGPMVIATVTKLSGTWFPVTERQASAS